MAVKKKQKSPAFTVLIMVVVAAVIVGAYLMLNRSDSKTTQESETKKNECYQILSRDMKTDYPGTVREVAKYYCRIQKCMINDILTDDEYEKLAERFRELLDEQLLAANPFDSHLASLKSERKSYESTGSKINSYTVYSVDKLKEKVVDGKEIATLPLYFTVKTDTEFNRSYEDFVFRKDSDGRWKILGWQLSKTEKVDSGE